MSDEQIRRIVDDSYDESKEEPLRTMLKTFYSRQLLSTAVLVWALGAAFIALACYSAAQFFQVEQIRAQIMYASLFILGVHGLGLMKIFAWQMLNRYGVRRDLKQMELCLAELTELLKTK